MSDYSTQAKGAVFQAVKQLSVKFNLKDDVLCFLLLLFFLQLYENDHMCVLQKEIPYLQFFFFFFLGFAFYFVLCCWLCPPLEEHVSGLCNKVKLLQSIN